MGGGVPVIIRNDQIALLLEKEQLVFFVMNLSRCVEAGIILSSVSPL